MKLKKMKLGMFILSLFPCIISCNEQEMPKYLYKVLSAENWEKTTEIVELSSMDSDFIHFSTEKQLDQIVKKYWSNVSEYIVLKIETEKLPGELVFETNPGGVSKYYHLYNGSIPCSAIVQSKMYKE